MVALGVLNFKAKLVAYLLCLFSAGEEKFDCNTGVGAADLTREVAVLCGLLLSAFAEPK